jgi:hypothetical protein
MSHKWTISPYLCTSQLAPQTLVTNTACIGELELCYVDLNIDLAIAKFIGRHLQHMSALASTFEDLILPRAENKVLKTVG